MQSGFVAPKKSTSTSRKSHLSLKKRASRFTAVGEGKQQECSHFYPPKELSTIFEQDDFEEIG